MFKLYFLLLTFHLVAGVDYHDTHDGMVFEKITTQQLRDFVNCILDKGPCSELNASYKKHYPAVIVEECNRCSVCQKHMTVVLFDRMKHELPALYEEYKKRWDPKNVHIDRLYKKSLADRDSSYC